MFDIEHRKGERTVGRQLIRCDALTEALARAAPMAAILGADYMTILDGSGELVGVFRPNGLVAA
ncbi:MAG TPA: hypothetical protein VHY34_12490 [Caulobacteraceae bacterium]|nr:hypothetical protein [Caulobacteraceae bacterium]